MNWLKNFKAPAIIYEIKIGEDEVLVVEQIQAKRVGRLRRQLLFRTAIKRGIDRDLALKYFLENKTEIPRYILCD
jgi:hypothetical protein